VAVFLKGCVEGLAEVVDVVDGEEGVFVDGVAVVAVPDDERVDAVELGEEHFEDAEGVHGAEGVGGVGSEEDFAEVVPEVGAFWDVDGEDGESVCDAVFSGLGEGVAVVADGGEDAQEAIGVAELRGGVDVDAALGGLKVEGEVCARDRGAAFAELLVKADGSG